VNRWKKKQKYDAGVAVEQHACMCTHHTRMPWSCPNGVNFAIVSAAPGTITDLGRLKRRRVLAGCYHRQHECREIRPMHDTEHSKVLQSDDEIIGHNA
jgi:hypothetical protein